MSTLNWCVSIRCHDKVARFITETWDEAVRADLSAVGVSSVIKHARAERHETAKHATEDEITEQDHRDLAVGACREAAMRKHTSQQGITIERCETTPDRRHYSELRPGDTSGLILRVWEVVDPA